jgi:hypothetical protein
MAHDNHFGHQPRPARNNTIKALRIAGLVVMGLIAAVAFALLLGLLVQWLWNAVVSNVFGVQPLTYWQALGLFILAKLLLGGFGSSHVTPRRSRRARGRGDEAGVQPPPCSDDFQRYWEEEGRAAFAVYLQRQEQARRDAEPE